MHYIVYKTTNKVNNKIYIGTHITGDIDDGYLGSGKVLKRAIIKYGEKLFEREILFNCSCEEEMYRIEREIVDEEFIARADTYNIILGGDGGFSHINSNKLNIYDGHGEQSIKNLSLGPDRINDLRKDAEWMEFYEQKLSNALKLRYTVHPHQWLGRKHSEETKKKIGAKNKISLAGSKNPNYGKVWVYNDSEKKTTRITREELGAYLNNGWKEGRKMSYGS